MLKELPSNNAKRVSLNYLFFVILISAAVIPGCGILKAPLPAAGETRQAAIDDSTLLFVPEGGVHDGQRGHLPRVLLG